MLARPPRTVLAALVALFFAAGPAWAQFETRASVPVLSNPISMAVGDFNHDGKWDLAVATEFNGGVAVLLGNGDGTFKPATYYTAGGAESSGSIATADLRGNGTLDLVVVNDSINALQVLLGNGDGTFGKPTSYPMPSQPVAVAAGDFNGDHKLDLVVATVGGFCPCISVLLGNGDGTFQEPPITIMPPVSPVAIGLGDFNHDGNLDVVTVGESVSGSEVGVLLGNGDGTFTPGANYTFGLGLPQSVAVGNFNRDGNLDLAVAFPLGGSIDILLSDGDGTFRRGAILPGLFASDVRAADLKGDGKLDLVFLTGESSDELSVAWGNGDGTFQPAISFPLAWETSAPTVADFNGDHQNDIVVANYLGNSVTTLLNTGVVSFSPIAPLNFGKQATGTTSEPQTVTLTNTGTTELKIASMKAAGEFGMTSTCKKSVAAGANCTISVRFTPPTQGAKSGTITILDSASSKPQVIELLGTGT
jgi:hypothetical protein